LTVGGERFGLALDLANEGEKLLTCRVYSHRPLASSRPPPGRGWVQHAGARGHSSRRHGTCGSGTTLAWSRPVAWCNPSARSAAQAAVSSGVSSLSLSSSFVDRGPLPASGC
jgi:hypothetical protein